MWHTTVLSKAPFQVPGRALVQALGRALVQVPGRALFKVPGRVLVQALGRAPHPHHSALLLSRFKKSCATASVEATFISTLYDSFIYMFEIEQHRSCFGKYLVSSFGSCFIYYEKHVNPFDGFFHIIRGRVLMYKSSLNEELAGAAAVSY